MILPLKQLRAGKRISQFELSKALKISPSAVGMWEQGRREPDYEMLKRIADYFDVSADYLLGREWHACPLSEVQRKLLGEFDCLSCDGQKLIMTMLDSLRMSHPKKIGKSKGNVVYNSNNANNYGNVVGDFSPTFKNC